MSDSTRQHQPGDHHSPAASSPPQLKPAEGAGSDAVHASSPEPGELSVEPAAKVGWWQRIPIRLATVGALFALLGGLARLANEGGILYEKYIATDTPAAIATALPTPTPAPTATQLPLTPRADGETLIVIATFHSTVSDAEAYVNIWNAIGERAEERGISNLRVEIEPTVLRAHQRGEAEELARMYGADMVIWGEDTGVQVKVNFLNLRGPDFPAGAVQFVEHGTEGATLLANPNAYAGYVTVDLPSQLTFLSLFAVGYSHYLRGEYANALEAIESAVGSLAEEADPPQGLDDAYFLLGWLYQVLQPESGQALAHFEQALGLDPDEPRVLANIGVVHADRGDWETALEYYEDALALDPSNADILSNIGVVYVELGDADQALEYYEDALAINPDDAAILANMGVVQAYRGDPVRALEYYERALALDPDNPATITNIGALYFELGDSDGALEYYEQALALDPGNVSSHSNIGVVYADRGDRETALEHMKQALALEPDNTDILYNIGLLHALEGDTNRALEYYGQLLALAVEAGDNGLERDVRYLVAKSHIDLEELDMAEAQLIRVVELDDALGHPDLENDRQRLQEIQTQRAQRN